VIRRFVAPGKLVLVGEYAVTLGVAGVAMAVDSGVMVETHPSDTLQIEAPGDTTYFERALRDRAAPPARYVAKDWNPPGTATKAGFGGSAAVVVAATLAARALSGLDTPIEVLAMFASTTHRAIQRNGSGIDVAASVYGRCIRFQHGFQRYVEAPRPVVVFSGESAATGPRVERFLHWSGATAWARGCEGLADRFESDPIEAFREADRALRGMATEADIAYATPGLDRIAALAADCGGASKASGAGGGDCAVALFPDADREAAFRRACEANGFQILAVNFAEPAREAA
jgi:mevalonate kinase